MDDHDLLSSADSISFAFIHASFFGAPAPRLITLQNWRLIAAFSASVHGILPCAVLRLLLPERYIMCLFDLIPDVPVNNFLVMLRLNFLG